MRIDRDGAVRHRQCLLAIEAQRAADLDRMQSAAMDQPKDGHPMATEQVGDLPDSYESIRRRESIVSISAGIKRTSHDIKLTGAHCGNPGLSV